MWVHGIYQVSAASLARDVHVDDFGRANSGVHSGDEVHVQIPARNG